MTSIRLRLRTLALGATLASGATACGGEDAIHVPRLAPLSATLTRAADCDDLLTRLRRDAAAKVDVEAWRALALYDEGGYYGYPVWNAGDGLANGGWLPPVAAPTQDAAPGAGSGGPERYTETNTQVAGVDEADFVETDGTHIYLLHDQSLFVLASWPPEATAATGALPIEGNPRQMFVANGRAVVFSDVWTYAAPVPTEDGGTVVGNDGGWIEPSYDGGVVEPSVDAGAPVPAEDGGVVAIDEDGGVPAPAEGGSSVPYPWTPPTHLTKITVVDVSGVTPTVIAERYVEGWYVDARRHDDVVRVVLRIDGFLPWQREPMPSAWNDTTGALVSRARYVDRLAAWSGRVKAGVAAASLADFVPSETYVDAGERVAVPTRCSDFYVPAPGEVAAGLVEVLAFDTKSPRLAEATVVAGAASVVYANAGTMVLAQNDWRWERFAGVATQETALHAFDLSGLTTSYTASGKVPGTILDQFALDEANGVVRVATTEDRAEDVPDGPSVGWFPTTPVNHVFTLGRSGERLVVRGQAGDLAPTERIQSVRYVGDLAYVVTFRQTDPLFVIDLSDPDAPTVLGELVIPGFSTYMHPLDPTHLLTIGRDVDPVSGQDLGLALSIFDVGDPAKPTRTHVLVVPGWSGAQWEHKNFVFDAATGLLAIPVEDYGYTFESSLRLLQVSVEGGIAPFGTISHTSLFDGCVDPYYPDYYTCGYSASVRRGLFIDGHVFTISYGGVTAHSLDDLGTAEALVALPQPTGYYVGWGWASAGGAFRTD